MKLFYSPGACSLGIHVVLEELGQPYTTERINLGEGAHRRPEYTAVNPKGKVPVLLRDDGSVLTEYGAISHYLAYDTKLAPRGREEEARSIEAIDYIVATMHMQGFQRIFRPGNFTPTPADEAHVKDRGRAIMAEGLQLMAGRLGVQDYLFGEFTHADCALFYVERWAGIGHVDLPAPIAAHLARMKARPAVQAVMAVEGIH